MSSMALTPQIRNLKPRSLARIILTADANERIRTHLLTMGWSIDDLRCELLARECQPEERPRPPVIEQRGRP